MTLRELLKDIEKKAEKKGILDYEIWESPSKIRSSMRLIVAHKIEPGKLEFFHIGYKHGGGKPIKAVVKER